MGDTKLTGITQSRIARQIYSHAVELVDDMLSIIYTHAENISTVDQDNQKVVNLDELRKIMETSIQLAYKKVKSL